MTSIAKKVVMEYIVCVKSVLIGVDVDVGGLASCCIIEVYI